MQGTLVVTDEAVVQTQLEFKSAERRLLCAIVLTRSGSVESSPLARIISHLRSIPYTSVLRRLIRGSGIIMRDATREEAAEVGAELTRQGFQYILVPTRELIQPPQVREIKNVNVTEVSLTFVTRDSEAFTAPWGELFIVTCGCVKREESATRPPFGGEIGYLPGSFLQEKEEVSAQRLIMTFFLSFGLTSMWLGCNLPEDASAEEKERYLPKHPFEKIGRVIYQMHAKQAQNKGMRILSLSGMKGAWRGLTFESVEQLREYNMWLAVLRKYQVNVIGIRHSKFSILSLIQPKFVVEEEVLAAAQLLRRARAEREKASLSAIASAEPSIPSEPRGLLVERSTLIRVSAIVMVILLILWILLVLLR
jgi:hypothetical protein